MFKGGVVFRVGCLTPSTYIHLLSTLCQPHKQAVCHFLYGNCRQLFFFPLSHSIGCFFNTTRSYFPLLQQLSASWVPLAIVEFRLGCLYPTYTVGRQNQIESFREHGCSLRNLCNTLASQDQLIRTDLICLITNLTCELTLPCVSTLDSLAIFPKQFTSYSGSIIHKSLCNANPYAPVLQMLKEADFFRLNRNKSLWPPFPFLDSWPVKAICLPFCRGKIKSLSHSFLVPPSNKEQHKYLNSKEKCSLHISL